MSKKQSLQEGPELEDQESQGPRSELELLLDIAQQRDFWYPAGIGLAVVVLALLFNSPFAWVLFFFYAVVFVPYLTLHLRGKEKALERQKWVANLGEANVYRRLREELAKIAAKPGLLISEIERAIRQHDQAVAMFKLLQLEVRGPNDLSLLKGRHLLKSIMERLMTVIGLLSALTQQDPATWQKKLQVLKAKPRLDDFDRSEIQAIEERIAAREQQLKKMVDLFRDNDRAIGDLTALKESLL